AADRLRVRGVEDLELGRREPAPQHLRGERGAAHAEEHELVDLGDDLARERVDLADALARPQRLVEPPEPVRLVGAGPDGRVPLPDPLDELLGGDQARTSSPRLARIPSSSSSNESENFCTPSRSRVSVTSSTETPAAS